MTETQLESIEKNTPVEVLEKMNETYRVGIKVMAVVIVGYIASVFVHELGHVLAFEMLGISTSYIFDIRIVGPVLGVEAAYAPATIEGMVFVVAAGGGFAAIVFAVLGRFWRTECYIIAFAQAFYALFEVVSWMIGLQTMQDVSIFPYLIVMCAIPTGFIADRIIGRMVRAEHFE